MPLTATILGKLVVPYFFLQNAVTCLQTQTLYL